MKNVWIRFGGSNYVPTTEDEMTRMKRELLFLADQGQFEFRPVDMN